MSIIAALVIAHLSKAGRWLHWQVSRFPWESAGERMLRLF